MSNEYTDWEKTDVENFDPWVFFWKLKDSNWGVLESDDSFCVAKWNEEERQFFEYEEYDNIKAAKHEAWLYDDTDYDTQVEGAGPMPDYPSGD